MRLAARITGSVHGRSVSSRAGMLATNSLPGCDLERFEKLGHGSSHDKGNLDRGRRVSGFRLSCSSGREEP